MSTAAGPSSATSEPRLFVGGAWAAAESGATFTAESPATGEPIGEVPQGGRADAQRAHAGLDDVRRRAEVRLADLEVDDPPSGRLERLRPRQHLERGLGAEPAHALRQSHCHVRSFSPGQSPSSIRRLSTYSFNRSRTAGSSGGGS